MQKHVVAGMMSYVVVALFAAGCVEDPAPFNPRALQQLQRDSSHDSVRQSMRPLPTTLESPFLNYGTTRPTTAPTTGPALGVEPTVRLSLQEIIHRAVSNNLDVRVAGYAPAIDSTRVVEAQARFDPVFFSNINYQNIKNQTGGTLTTDPRTLQPITTDIDREWITTFQTGIRQNLENGGQVELRYEVTNSDFNPRRFVINPIYENNLVLQITQPLLRNFGSEVNRARITIARNNQKISLLEFRKTLEENLANIETAYWQLVEAERNVRIEEDLLKQTLDTGDILFKRRQQDVTRVQISQANASIETRRAELVRRRSDVRNLSDRIKELMYDPELPVSSSLLILPADAPTMEPIQFDLAEQIDVALDNRLELLEQQARIDNASVTVGAAKNNLLPKLDMVGSVGANGVGSGMDDAFDNQRDADFLSWSIGLQFEVPIGNREARAIYRRTLLQRQQSIDQYRSLIEQLTREVKQAAREVHTTWDEMVARRQASFALEDALLAIEQRKAANEPLTPTFVQLELDSQERLAQGRRDEAAAVSGYQNAIATLERAKGTLLRYNNVVMEENRQLIMR